MTILILPILLLLLLAAPFALYFAFRKHMTPEVFIDGTEGYGLRKPHWSRQVVCIIGIPLSGLADAILDWRRGYNSAYKPYRTEHYVTDPTIYEGKTPSKIQMFNYLSERADVVCSAIASAGWRRVFYRHIIELPTETKLVSGGDGDKLGMLVGKGSFERQVPSPWHTGRNLRLTKFILY